MIAPPYFGLETELAVCGEKERRLHPSIALDRVLRSEVGKGLSLGDKMPGFGCYVDCGRHLEIFTPVCDDPFDLAKFLLLQDKVVHESLEHIVKIAPGDADFVREFSVNRTSSEPYSEVSWGCHENYSTVSEFGAISDDQFADHIKYGPAKRAFSGFLAVRTAMVCEGHPVHRHHLGFNRSGRARLMTLASGGSTTSDRGMYAFKSRRCHVISAASNMSDWQNILKVGSAALMHQALVDLVAKGRASEIPNSLGVLDNAAQCARGLAEEEGLNDQETRLARAQLEFVAGAPVNPPWKPHIIAMWDETLTAIENNDFDWLSFHLDYYIKRRMFADSLVSLGEWDKLALLNSAYHDVNPDVSLHKQAVSDDLVYSAFTDDEVEAARGSTPSGPTKERIAIASDVSALKIPDTMKNSMVGRVIDMMAREVRNALIASSNASMDRADMQGHLDNFIKQSVGLAAASNNPREIVPALRSFALTRAKRIMESVHRDSSWIEE